MPKHRKATDHTEAPLFKAWINASLAELQFLIDEYGFRLESTKATALECSIRFVNDTTGVNPAFEIGTMPTIYLSKLLPGEPRKWGETYAIDYLIIVRCPDRQLGVDPIGLSTGDLGSILKHYAMVLRDHARDILRGDFTCFPALKRVSRHRI